MLMKMQNNNEKEMIKYLESNGFKVVGVKKYHALTKDYEFFLHKEEGREVLRKNHFYFVKETREKISGAFNQHFICSGCRYEKERGTLFSVCTLCIKVQNILKSM